MKQEILQRHALDQGTDLPEFTVPRDYIRSVTIHDQLSTAGIFDALWLSYPVRSAYATLHNYRVGKAGESGTMFLRRQLEENAHFISFYVLSGQEIALGTDISKWAVLLNVGKEFYSPTEITAVDLPVEYQHFFGKKFSSFKTPYLVRFDAKGAGAKFILNADVKQLELVFRSSGKEGKLTWSINKEDRAYSGGQ